MQERRLANYVSSELVELPPLTTVSEKRYFTLPEPDKFPPLTFTPKKKK